MKVRSLVLKDVPGLGPRSLVLEQLDEPVLLVLGPNGAGKSTTRRCLEQLLFENHDRLRNAHLTGAFRLDSEPADGSGGDPLPPLVAEQKSGEVRWMRGETVVEKPTLPPRERADCYAVGARELLAAGDPERDFAAAVRREMAGGFDLREVRDGLVGEAFAPRYATTAASNVREARERLLAVERQLDALADDEDRLEELRADAARADEAAVQRARLANALEGLRAALDRAAPAEVALGELDEQLALLDERVAQLDRSGALPTAELLDRTGRELSELARADEALRHKEETVHRVAGRERKARAALTDAERAQARIPSLDTVGRLDRLWNERASERLRRDEARARLAALGELEGGRPMASAEALQAAIGDLEQWLSASPVAGRPIPRAATIAAWVVLAAAIAAAVQVDPWFAVLAGLAVAFLFASFQLRLALGPVRVQREQAEQRFATRGVSTPPLWEQPSVDALLRRLREERERVRRRELDAGERQRAQVLAEQAEARLAQVEAEFDALREQSGVDLDGLALVDWAKRLHEWRDADLQLAEERGAREQARRERDALAGRLAEALGLESGPENDHAALAARRESLAERRSRRDGLAREREARAAERERAAAGLARARDEAARAAATLEVAPGSDLAEVEAAVLPTIDHLARAAEGRDALLEEIASIQTRLDEARRRGEWDEARARHDAAANDLAGTYDARLDALCAAAVLDDAEREYERESRPEVLERAGVLFGRFTHQRYELLASETEGEDPRFAAQDVETGERRELEELSDGTRMQLLLALRIAFAEQGESDEKVPIVLDEVFSMSDPDRVRSMVDALGDLAREGRQVVYLGADPALEAAWRAIAEECGHHPPRVVHLDRVQQAIRGVTDATELAVRAAHTVPDPAGMTPEEFGRMIGVGLLLPYEDAGALHLFHLLRDELPALAKLLKQKIDTLGKWERLVAQDGAAKAIGDDALAAKLSERGAAARALVEAWHVGRGRAMGRAELEETKAVSDNWVDRFEAVLTDLGGSASLLLEAVEKEGSERDPRLKGFRAHKVTALRSFLIEKGLLDPRPHLSLEDQDARARAAAPTLDAVEVTDLADTVRAQLERGLPPEARREAREARATSGAPEASEEEPAEVPAPTSAASEDEPVVELEPQAPPPVAPERTAPATDGPTSEPR